MSEYDPLVELIESEFILFGGQTNNHIIGDEPTSEHATGEPTNRLVFERVDGRTIAKFIDLATNERI